MSDAKHQQHSSSAAAGFKKKYSHGSWCYVRSLLTPHSMVEQNPKRGFKFNEYMDDNNDPLISFAGVFSITGVTWSAADELRFSEKEVLAIVKTLRWHDNPTNPYANVMKSGQMAKLGGHSYKVQSVGDGVFIASTSSKASGREQLRIEMTGRCLIAIRAKAENMPGAQLALDHVRNVMSIDGY
jgi:hypothetical protein